MKGAYHFLGRRPNDAIPNLRSEGAQKRDLTKLVRRHEKSAGSPPAGAQDLVSFVMIRSHRKVPLSSAFGVRVRDDTTKFHVMALPASSDTSHNSDHAISGCRLRSMQFSFLDTSL